MELYEQISSLCAAACRAKLSLANAGAGLKNDALSAIAKKLGESKEQIINANRLDLERAADNGVPPHMLDRLTLNEKRIDAIINSLYEIVSLTDPIGQGECWVRPSGIKISAVKVPLGVIGIIYEARPNVTVDAAALCLKTGNAVILRGGKEAINSNIALVDVMKSALTEVGLDPDAIGLITDVTHEGANILMTMTDYVDVLIPRGSHRLIAAVKQNSRVPVIETGAGNCHLYIHADADTDMAVKIALNAKCQRPSVCNAIETLVVNRSVAAEVLPKIADAMKPYGVEFRCDEYSAKFISDAKAATANDWSTEYDDYILAVKTVDTLDEAIDHINRHNTKHSEAIITRSLADAERFQREIDAAAVYVNASTRFTDGGEFGFGAEIGISTQKLHARGPMGLDALTTTKYLINGNGDIRK